MKFKGNGSLYNGNTGKFYEFVNGEYETEDQTAIAHLKANGFGELESETITKAEIQTDNEIEVEETQEVKVNDWAQLKRDAKALGIHVHGKTREQLLKAIAEK